MYNSVKEEPTWKRENSNNNVKNVDKKQEKMVAIPEESGTNSNELVTLKSVKAISSAVPTESLDTDTEKLEVIDNFGNAYLIR
jgi:hypothetical protein